MAIPRTVYLCAARRTPIGSFQGALASASAPELGASVVKQVLSQSHVPAEEVDGVIMGCVLTAGIGQAPARQAALGAGLPNSVQALSVNKVCSSGLKAVMIAGHEVALGVSNGVIAGGMESMSQAPYLMPSLRTGARLGHTQAVDSIVKDGLWDVYNDFHMGNAAELCARTFKLTREMQDQFAVESYTRAMDAIAAGHFRSEIVPVTVKDGKSEKVVDADEEPGRGKLDKFSSLRPAFDKDGTVTAANASSINDGAAAMLVCSEEFSRRNNLTPMARIVDYGWNAREPEWFTTAPIGAVQMVLNRAKKSVGDIDLFEINEAFSAVALACRSGLEIDPGKLNVCGGAVALGHPIGASGARILTTLLHSLQRTKGRFGVAAICNGGGEATALLVERL